MIAIENHSNSLLNSPESIRRFAALLESDRVGIALAPHHLPQDGNLLADLAGNAGSAVKFVYAQQYGHGSSEKLPKEKELLQLPGRGSHKAICHRRLLHRPPPPRRAACGLASRTNAWQATPAQESIARPAGCACWRRITEPGRLPPKTHTGRRNDTASWGGGTLRIRFSELN